MNKFKDWASNNSFYLRRQYKKSALTGEKRSTVCTHMSIRSKHMHHLKQISCQRIKHFDDVCFREMFY